MFKGMQRGFLCVCLSVSFFVSDILEDFWQGLSAWLGAFESTEVDNTTLPPLDEGDDDEGAPTQSADGPPPPGTEDDDGNIGGGTDPWG